MLILILNGNIILIFIRILIILKFHVVFLKSKLVQIKINLDDVQLKKAHHI